MIREKEKTSKIMASIVFLTPALFLIAVFIIYPIFYSFYLSFHEWNGIDPVKKYIGFQNWTDLLADKIFFHSIVNNIYLVVLSIIIQIPIGIFFAVILNKGGQYIKTLKTIYYFPMLISPVAIGILFKYIYDPTFGILSNFLKVIGLAILAKDWLGDPKIAIYSIIAVICWQYIPFYMVLFLAALSTIPEEMSEAAKVEGATNSQYFWRIELPLLGGTVKTATILSLIGSLKYFDLIYVMTEGGPAHATELMATYMYKNAFAEFKMGYGSTIASALFLVVTVVSSLTFFLTTRFSRRND